MEGAVLHAQVQVSPQGVTIVSGSDPSKLEDYIKWQPASFPLDLVLGNIDGTFQYGCKGFSASGRNIRLDGTVIRAELRTAAGEWKQASIDLNDRICAKDGKLYAGDVPVVVPVPKVSY